MFEFHELGQPSRRLVSSLSLFSLLLGWLVGGALSAAEPAPLKLLFLGDNGHHRPQERFVQIEPVLRARGIEVKYTDDPADLNAQALAGFDGLILFANIDRITPEQDQALLDYVERGKGFIPLHCASYCFRNSPRFVALVGAQFQKHGGEVFGVENVRPDHPIMKGYGGFESWDETYIHTLHNEKDRIVLEERLQGEQAPGRKSEPWTWVRTQGKGRVFYTAWGHDQRTWGNPGFQNLLERGIRWACQQDPSAVPAWSDPDKFVVPQMTAIAPDAAKFEFIDVGPKIPNYTPGEKWGVQGAAKNLMQQPLSPKQSMQHYSVPAGFELQLFASEPDLGGKPIAMTWDERGRLWVCETYDYPNELQPPGQGRDRIRICEDTDGDGKADKFTLFAEKLSIPTSIAFHRSGVIVQDGVETLYLKDTDGDDKADLRQVIITGWALGDTHGGVSNFQYGLDNWIWAMQGYNNSAPVIAGGKEVSNFRMGFFRFQVASPTANNAEVPALEFVRSTNNNTWGLGMSEEGVIFGSTANRNPSVYMPIANRYYERVRGWSAEQLGTIADTYLFKPIREDIRQVDQFGGYTAGCGHSLYTARTYPEQYWNRTAFVCGPTGHLVGTFLLKKDGADFHSTSPMNLVASDDDWAAPIMAEVGPDGNVWVLDWYNFIVQHNPTPQGFKTGKGNAYESDLRDKKYGRVYRVTYTAESGKRTAESQNAPLSIDRPQELVAALKRDNLLWRRHAQRLLVERGQTDVVPALLKLVADQSVDSIGLNTAAIHALWTLHGLGVVQDNNAAVWPVVVAALKHPSAGVRRNAVQVLPAAESSTAAILGHQLTRDADPQVRLAATLALADMPASDQAGIAVAVQILDPQGLADRWQADAVTAAAAAQALPFLEGVVKGQSLSSVSPAPRLSEKAANTVAIVAEHIARGRPASDEVARLVKLLATSEVSLSESVLAGLSRGWPKDAKVELSEATEQQLVEVLQRMPAGSKGALIRLAMLWGSKELEKYAAEIVESLLKVVKDGKASDDDRVAAAEQLLTFQSQSDDVVESLLDVVSPQSGPEFVSRLIGKLSVSQAPALGETLVEKSRSFTPSARVAAFRVLLGRPQTTVAFLAAVEAGKLQLADLTLDQKQALAAHPDRSIRERAQKLLKQLGGLPSPDRDKVLQELLPLAQQTGDAVAGKEIYKKQCAKCHVHSGEGTKIGPDLTGMAVHPKSELLVHILDPSRSVEGNYRVYTVVLNDGRVMTGMLAGESRTAVELIDTEAKRHPIQREDIEELVSSTKSLMPEGFEKQVKPEEVRDLLEFLTKRGKYVPLDLAKVATVVSTRGMFINKEADPERLIFPDWSPKVFEGVPFQLVDPEGDRRPNAILLQSPNGPLTRDLPRTVTLPCNMPAKAIHFLSGVSGWGFPYGQEKSVTLIVRLKYADGTTEDHALKNGEEFADYIRVVDVPKSKLAFRLRGQQIRYFAVTPERAEKIATIELVKGPDTCAPVVMGVTIESRE